MILRGMENDNIDSGAVLYYNDDDDDNNSMIMMVDISKVWQINNFPCNFNQQSIKTLRDER